MINRRGFSLVELMVCIFIISSCLLLIIGLFTFLFNSSRKGLDLTAGISAGEMIMEEFLYNSKDELQTNGGLPIETSINKTVNGVTFLCDINVTSPVYNKLRKVEATIYWWLDPNSKGFSGRKYRVMDSNGKYKDISTDPGFVAEYGAIKTKITKLIFVPVK